MPTKAENSIVAHPDWSQAQLKLFGYFREALPLVMSYLGSEIPVLDNTSDEALIDEVGLLKQLKKPVEKAEKTHVERLKARLGDKDSMDGTAFKAEFRGSSRVILKQEACKAFIETCDEEGIHIGRLMEALKKGEITIPPEVLLDDPSDDAPAESNREDFFTTAAGGRSLYVDPIL